MAATSCAKSGSISSKSCLCNRRWGGAAGGASGGGVAGDSSEDEEEQDANIGRAEELRRERLAALVKRNLTTILLEVTDAMFGARLSLILMGEKGYASTHRHMLCVRFFVLVLHHIWLLML